MKRNLVIGNWKMNASLTDSKSLLSALQTSTASLSGVDIAICPPFPYLAQASSHLADSHIELGAQNLNQHLSGAFTGEVSGSMLKDLGCSLVLIGHSERRTLFGESSDDSAEKFAAALRDGLLPVLCVGETLAERRAGVTEQVVTTQLQAVIDLVGVSGLNSGVIAYEPVWAIGTGETATPAQAQEVHRHIRSLLTQNDVAAGAATRILYGGSVKPDNAAELFLQDDIDGGLIGGASLDAASFAAICSAAQH
jgi:triosephosphate isomerase